MAFRLGKKCILIYDFKYKRDETIKFVVRNVYSTLAQRNKERLLETVVVHIDFHLCTESLYL